MNPSQLAIEMFPLPGDTGFVRTHCRRNDPGTSQKAAERAKKFARGQCVKILESFRKNGPQTPKEVGRDIGLTSEQVTRRTSDLKAAGLLRLTGEEREDCEVMELV